MKRLQGSFRKYFWIGKFLYSLGAKFKRFKKKIDSWKQLKTTFI